MKKEIIRTLLIASALTLVACAPRGESKTLEELLEVAKNRMSEVDNVNSGRPEEVAILKTNLEKVLTESQDNPAQVAPIFAELSANLSALILHASPTTRPAMQALLNQYRELGKGGQISEDQVILLVSRTYHTLASELETTSFRL